MTHRRDQATAQPRSRADDTGSHRAIVVAIDGPAGAGKSTVGHAVARRLGIQYLDTGAMYRAVTFAALQRGVSVEQIDAVADLTPGVSIVIEDERVMVDGVDATDAIRGREVTQHVSAVAANSAVRRDLVERQRAWVEAHGGGVVEGRDIGSVVFPDADLKLYITASPRVRAQRRVAQTGGDLDAVEAAIIERDRYDSSRADSPLTTTDDMVVVDTTGLSITEVVDRIVDLLPIANATSRTVTSGNATSRNETTDQATNQATDRATGDEP